ncbi:hypothetical protein ACFLUU_05525 [Chloroflexota bacterium]
MEIKIKSSNQFNGLLNSLAGEIIDGECYFKLHEDLITAIPDYEEVYNQSNTFWSLTTKALLDATLSRLCRVYDQHSNSLSLCNLLDTIEANLEIFDTENFKERLQDNPFVRSLAQTARRPNADTLKQDMQSANDTDPLVKKLVIWRNSILAHKTATVVVKQIDITKNYPISRDDISLLLSRATAILNGYSGLFRASTYLTQIIGHDDYLYILETIKEIIRKYKEGRDSIIART